MYNEDKIILKDENGVEKEYYKLIIFNSNITNKDYIIYTDNTYSNNILNIYSSIILDDNKIEKITDDIDLKEVEKAIIKVKAQLGNDS